MYNMFTNEELIQLLEKADKREEMLLEHIDLLKKHVIPMATVSQDQVVLNKKAPTPLVTINISMPKSCYDNVINISTSKKRSIDNIVTNLLRVGYVFYKNSCEYRWTIGESKEEHFTIPVKVNKIVKESIDKFQEEYNCSLNEIYVDFIKYGLGLYNNGMMLL